jgi:hypothetical protein
MKTLITIGIATAACLPSEAAVAACTVTKDDGTTFNDQSVSSCFDYYRSEHACHSLVRSKDNACTREDMFMAVDWNGVDIIDNLHRGLWGLTLSKDAATQSTFDVHVGGAPESSLQGMRNALVAGLRTVEYDVFLMRDDQKSTTTKTPIVSHFQDIFGFTDYGGPRSIPLNGKGVPGWVMGMEYDASAIYHLLERGGDISSNLFISFSTLISFARSEQKDAVIVVDPKNVTRLYETQLNKDGKVETVCIAFCDSYGPEGRKEEMLSLLAAIVQVLKDKDAFSNVIIKVPQIVSASELATRIGTDSFRKLLFAPSQTRAAPCPRMTCSTISTPGTRAITAKLWLIGTHPFIRSTAGWPSPSNGKVEATTT